MDWKLALQIIGVALGLLYLYLEYRANIWLWVVGIIMPVVHGVLYFRSGLYADCSMQVYYVLAGLYGLAMWRGSGSHGREDKQLSINHTPRTLWWRIATVYAMLHTSIYMLLVAFTDSNVPFWDSMTTAMCIVAYWMLSRKYIEQWLVWLVVDVVTVGLYLYKDIPLTASLYCLYSVLAIVGYRRWREMMLKGEA
ncbi:MAG: nicotinamide mononucleotide transporter [Alistipes sp.]|nr:nicotinamide mononucleotide transporter [Alistipes sp.]